MSTSIDDACKEVMEKFSEEERGLIKRIGPDLMKLAALDQTRFCLDLDDVYMKITGETRRDNVVQRKLKKFTEGVDYKAEKFAEAGRTKYTLTPRCFKGMLQESANKDVRHAAHKYFCFCEETLAQQKLNEERVKKRPIANDVDGSRKRIQACETVKEFTEAVADIRPNFGRGDYAYLNGLTNKAVTGGFKHDWAKKWEVEPKKLNLRDHMASETLAATTALQFATTQALKANPSENPREVHERNCALMAEMMKFAYPKSVTREPGHTLRDSRLLLKDAALEEGRKQALPMPPPAGRITNFFQMDKKKEK